MKFLTIILIVLGSFDLFAQTAKIKRLERSETKRVKAVKVGGNNEVLQKIMEQGRRIDEVLKQRSRVPVIWEYNAKILTGKFVRGTLLNSIHSTNLASPVLVLAHDGQGLPFKTKFSCHGVTQNERVFALCNKMINSEREIPISAQVLNLDGTSGLLGEFDDGKDDLIAGTILSDFAQGMLSAAQSRVATPFGSANEVNLKNQMLGGFIESGKATSEILTDEMKASIPKVSVDVGTEVLVYFMEAVNES